MKAVQHDSSLGECRPISQWHLFTPVRKAISGRKEVLTRIRGTGTLGTAVKCSKDCKIVQALWKTVVISQNTKHRITIRPSTAVLNMYPKEPKARNRYLYIHVQSSIIHNSQKVEAIRVSIDGWMDKQNVVLCNYKWSICLPLRRKEIMTHATTWMNLNSWRN